jgi:hypothetical protein
VSQPDARIITVDLPVVEHRRVALIVTDSADLEAQAAARKAQLLAAIPAAFAEAVRRADRLLRRATEGGPPDAA